MTQLIAPQVGERCNDPACGTFGFMIAADAYVKSISDDYCDLTEKQAEFQVKEAFTGGELVHETHRLALMNAMLHNIEGRIVLGDTLSESGKAMTGYDVVLTNPPFGTKKGGERATRDDFTYTTSNKQLNFLQHIYRSLKADGKARAAVVLPDNVLFADGDGEKIRVDLMNKCNLHTVLRLPTGIFYAKVVKTNVLFFTRGKNDENNTKEVWFYDLRTNMPSFGKTNQLKKEHFADFIKAYTAEDRASVKDERWNCFTRDQIAAKGNSLDLGLIRDESILDYEDLPDPIESAKDCIDQLEMAADLIRDVVKELLTFITQEYPENEWVEYKHNFHSKEEIGERISALSNSACLNNKHFAYLIYGIEVGTRKIVETDFHALSKKVGNDELEIWDSVKFSSQFRI